MRTIINYVRSCFCKHEWELIFDVKIDGTTRDYSKKVYRCKKCGYSRTNTTYGENQ